MNNLLTKHWIRTIVLFAFSGVLFSTALIASNAQKTTDPKLLDYDHKVPFDLKESSTKEENGAVITDVNYAGYTSRHGRIKAYLVKPKGAGPFAGVVFFHWLGRPKGDRTQFLDEAVALSKRGVVSLLIQGYFPWTEPPKDGPTDRQKIIDQTIEARRAIDLLLTQKGVDRKRVGYVGHDYGSMFGGIVAGTDRRVKAYVLIAGLGRFSPWSLKYWPKTAAQGNAAYEEAVSPLDPIIYVARANAASFLFQFANTDEYITKEEATAFFDRASKPKEIKWYDGEHDLNVEAARKDRNDFLTRQLRLPLE